MDPELGERGGAGKEAARAWEGACTRSGFSGDIFTRVPWRTEH